MEHIRLMSWCRTCLTGVHLPAFAAAEAGLFADRGIEVEFVNLIDASEASLQGFATRPKAIAAGWADFALTSVPYVLAAQTATGGRLPVRFAAICHQRNPLCAVVREDSDLWEPGDLAGRRVARWSMPWFAQEYGSALRHLGIQAPVVVDMTAGKFPQALDAALGRGEIDAIPTLTDMTWHHRNAGFPIRSIPLDVGVYTSGLVAADRLDPRVVADVCDAYVAGFDLQLRQPELGITGFRRRYPEVSEEHVRMNWDLFEPNAFHRAPPGVMDADRWEFTIRYTAKTHDLSELPGERMYRPEMLTPPQKPAPALGEQPPASVHPLRTRSGRKVRA